MENSYFRCNRATYANPFFERAMRQTVVLSKDVPTTTFDVTTLNAYRFQKLNRQNGGLEWLQSSNLG